MKKILACSISVFLIIAAGVVSPFMSLKASAWEFTEMWPNYQDYILKLKSYLWQNKLDYKLDYDNAFMLEMICQILPDDFYDVATGKKDFETLISSVHNDYLVVPRTDNNFNAGYNPGNVVGTTDKDGNFYILNSFISAAVTQSNDMDLDRLKEIINTEIGENIEKVSILSWYSSDYLYWNGNFLTAYVVSDNGRYIIPIVTPESLDLEHHTIRYGISRDLAGFEQYKVYTLDEALDMILKVFKNSNPSYFANRRAERNQNIALVVYITIPLLSTIILAIGIICLTKAKKKYNDKNITTQT